MEILGWIGARWFELLQTTSILVGFFITAHTIRMDARERRIQNLFSITESHRAIWATLYERPELHRILDLNADLKTHPATPEERLFVHLLILHLRASFKARKNGMEFDDDSVALDISDFFRRPIPLSVWKWTKKFQDPKFVHFVESSLKHQKRENSD